MYRVACVHGRFQPFHFGHLEYLTEASKRCDFLWVGLTQLYNNRLFHTDQAKHRGLLRSNPLTYWERVVCISSALSEYSIKPGNYGFLPFPIENPSDLHNFVGKEVVCFTTIYDEWNRHKLKTLSENGYTVEVLWERSEKPYSGESIRQKMLSGDSWKNLMPESVAVLMKNWDIPKRLKDMQTMST